MSNIQLQTNPICPKCKKGHTMKLVAFNDELQMAYYQTDCRKLPLKISIHQLHVVDESKESFYFNALGWISYLSGQGNYVHKLSLDIEENIHALAAAYAGGYGVYHEPKVAEENDLLEF